MASEDGNEGLSTPKKVATGAAVGLATAAAVGVGKKLLGSNGDSDEGGGDTSSRTSGSRGRSTTSRTSRSRSTGSTSRARSRSTGTNSKTGSRSTTRSRSKTRSSTSGRSSGTTRTKEQLYAQAKRLKIDGRSRMTKAQLERAVASARS